MKFNQQSLSMLDTPWLRRQVEAHLIFGPLTKSFSFGWLLIIAFAINFFALFGTKLSLYHIIEGMQRLFFILLSVMLLKLGRYHQAALGWCVTKFTIGVFAFLMLIAGGLVGFFRHQSDAIHFTLLALIWFPGLEFLPKFTSKQRFITIARLILTIPVAYWGYKTGNWYWK